MLALPGSTFSLYQCVDFSFAGILVHRGLTSRMNHLIDVTPILTGYCCFQIFTLVENANCTFSSNHDCWNRYSVLQWYYNFEIGFYLNCMLLN
jgi:ABC-2 type transport system permease protein